MVLPPSQSLAELDAQKSRLLYQAALHGRRISVADFRA